MENLEHLVWVSTLRTFGFVIRRDAYYSIVSVKREGEWQECEIDNDDYEYIFEYETD